MTPGSSLTRTPSFFFDPWPVTSPSPDPVRLISTLLIRPYRLIQRDRPLPSGVNSALTSGLSRKSRKKRVEA